MSLMRSTMKMKPSSSTKPTSPERKKRPHEGLFRFARVFPIAGHDLRPGDANLSGFSAWDLLCRILEGANADLGAGKGRPMEPSRIASTGLQVATGAVSLKP